MGNAKLGEKCKLEPILPSCKWVYFPPKNNECIKINNYYNSYHSYCYPLVNTHNVLTTMTSTLNAVSHFTLKKSQLRGIIIIIFIQKVILGNCLDD